MVHSRQVLKHGMLCEERKEGRGQQGEKEVKENTKYMQNQSDSNSSTSVTKHSLCPIFNGDSVKFTDDIRIK